MSYDHLFDIASSDMPVSGEEVDEAIDEYAHELAEEIRKYQLPESRDRHWVRFGMNIAADLIDPYKENR